MRGSKRSVTTDRASSPIDPARAFEWLVDGYNVLHSGLLQDRERREWWTEAHRRRLLSRVVGFDDPGAEIRVVFDGGRSTQRDPEAPASPRLHTVFAPSADDWLVARVRAATHPEGIAVVTADRRLASRVRHLGARVVSPRDFLSRCRESCEREAPDEAAR